MAAQGFDLTEGSNLDLLSETEELGEFDRLKIQNNTEREAYAARVQGMNYESQAGLYRAKAGAQNPFLAGTSSLLSGAGSVAGQWYGFQNSGAFK